MNCIIFGGVTPEHEISIISAFQVKSFLPDAQLIYFSKDYEMYLANRLSLEDFKAGRFKKLQRVYFINGGFKTRFKRYSISCAIPLIHGNNGEDGALSGMLNLYNIPYVGCSIYSGALFMNKALTHEALQRKGYPVTNFYLLRKKDFIFDAYENTFPCIIKPNASGSSIGIYVCHNEAEFTNYASEVFKITEEIIVEEYISDFEEYNVALSSGYTSNVHKICNKGDIFSFEDKYQSEFKLKNKVCSKQISVALSDMARKLYKDFGLFGIVRIDFLVTKDNIYVCELNTAPGALSNYMFDDFYKVLQSEIQRASMEQFRRKNDLKPLESNLFHLNKFTK